MNAAAMFTLYKAISPPIATDHAAGIVSRLEQAGAVERQLQVPPLGSHVPADESAEAAREAAELTTRLSRLSRSRPRLIASVIKTLSHGLEAELTPPEGSAADRIPELQNLPSAHRWRAA